MLQVENKYEILQNTQKYSKYRIFVKKDIYTFYKKTKYY